MALSLLISAWIAGALGTVHCVAMCGGFLAASSGVGQAGARGTAVLLPARALALGQLACHLGRVSTYTLLGALAGSAGGALAGMLAWGPVQRALFVIANLFLLGLAVTIVSRRELLRGVQRAGAALFRSFVPALHALRARNAAAARYAFGMLWGLVPCTLVYSVLPIASLAGGAWQGAAVMLAFGLGTLPAAGAAGWALVRAASVAEHRAVRGGAAALIGGFALVGMWRALYGPLTPGQGAFCLVP